MFELNCEGVIPNCHRVIRADSEAEVVRRAVCQAKELGVSTITPTLLDAFRRNLHQTRN